MRDRLGGNRPEDEVEEELRFHLEGRVEEWMASGMTREQAEAEARRRFGDAAAVAAECVELEGQRQRHARRRSRWDALRLDVRLAWRGLLRDRGLATAVVATLGITIGAVTALFSLTDAILLRPLPYPDDSALVYLWQNDRLTGTDREAAGTADFYDFRERSTSFESMSMFARGSGTLATSGGTRFVSTRQLHHDMLSVLGVSPILGRGFSAEETRPGAAPVIVLSEGLWRTQFDGDPGVLGSTVALGDVPHEVIGIVRDDASTLMGGAVDAWTPLQVDRTTAARNPHYVTVVARLRPSVELASAQTEMAGIALQLEEEVPANANRGAFVERGRDYLRGDLRATLWTVFGATVVLLLIGAANVGSLLSARATHRDRVTAVHTALGAGPGRTLARGLVESAMLVGAASLVGLGVAVVGMRVLEGASPPELVALADISIDLRVLGFTVLLASALATVFGTIPARHATRQDLQRSLGHGAAGGRGRAAGLPLLVAGQAALATVLLVGSLLLGATLRNMMTTDLGFSTESTLRASIVLPDARYPRSMAVYPDFPEVLDFQQRLLARLDATPGVAGHALVSNHPLDPGFTNSFGIVEREVPDGIGEITTRMITPGYFDAASVRIVEGRTMNPGLGPADPNEVLINETAARILFPDGGAVGSHMQFWGPAPRRIVGIVEDERVQGHRSDAPIAAYVNLLQNPPLRNPTSLLVRAQGDPAELLPVIQQVILEVEPAAAVHELSTMRETLSTVLIRERFAGTLLTAFSLIAIFLAAIGVHGVLAFSIARRRREIGIRLALGESRSGVRTTVLRRATALVGAGVVMGVLLALVSARGLESLLFGIAATDPRVYVAAASLLVLAGLAGALVPALRASSVEPATSLRSE